MVRRAIAIGLVSPEVEGIGVFLLFIGIAGDKARLEDSEKTLGPFTNHRHAQLTRAIMRRMATRLGLDKTVNHNTGIEKEKSAAQRHDARQQQQQQLMSWKRFFE